MDFVGRTFKAWASRRQAYPTIIVEVLLLHVPTDDMVYSPRIASASKPSAMQDTDLALTEMELLEQNQRRLGNLTGRMTTILNGFDRRLVRLESSILPIHKSTQTLSRISSSMFCYD